MRKGIPFEEGILGLKTRRGALGEIHSPVIDLALDMLEEFGGVTKELDRQVHEAVAASKEVLLLTSIPGVGDITALSLVAYLCPIERFGNIDQVSAYCGLAPSTYQSGDRVFQWHLRSDSHQLLRWVLVKAAWRTRAVEKRGDAAKAGNRSARRRGKGTGSVSATHKLLKICYAVLRRGTSYQPHAPEPSSRANSSADSSSTKAALL